LKKLFRIIFFIGVLLFNGNIYSRSDTLRISGDTTNLSRGNQEELLLESSLEDTEDSKLLDYLEDLKKNSFDLNTVSREDLESIPFINSIIAKNIIEYRNENGSFKSKRDLLYVDGVNDRLYGLIKTYVVVKKSETDYVEDDDGKIYKENRNENPQILKDIEFSYRTRFQQDLQTKEGFLNGQYPGSKAKIYNRLNFIYNKSKYILQGNITTEKDAGERSITDFSSGYLEFRSSKILRTLIAGDYSLTFGQGLGMWSGTGFYKGSSTVDPVKKRGYGLNGYSSVNESQFFRGAASDINYNNFDFILFYSNNYFDASIDTTLDEVSSFYFDGYHRTISEQNRKKSAKESLFGSRILFNKNNLKLGATIWTSKFSKPVEFDSTRQLYSFSGDNANMLSFDYDYIYNNINIFGEFARSQSGIVAGLGALYISLSKFAELVFLYRHYPEDFSQVHSFGFGENNGNTQNESGLYSGLSIEPFKGLEVNAYFDQFKFPYRTYSNPASTSGNDFLTNVNYAFNKDLTLNFRYKSKNKEDTRTVQDESGRLVKKIDNRSQTNFRLGFDYDITDRFKLRSRYDYVFVKYDLFGGNNKGSLFFTDLRFNPAMGVSISTRFLFFETDSYDSRLYEYEEDIRGVMSNLGLYGKGRRWYVMVKFKPLSYVEISGKYAETYMDGAKSIGTGNDLIQGDTNNKINLGMEILF